MSFKLRPTKEELILRIENSLKLKDVADSYNVSQQSVIDNIVQKNVLEATEKVKPTKNYMEKIDQRK